MALTYNASGDLAAGFARLTDLPNSVMKSSLGSTLTLTTGDSGNLITFDRAAGTAVTLPATSANTVGTTYTFLTTVTLTSNSNTIVTSGTDKIIGGVSMLNTTAGNTIAYPSVIGTANVRVNQTFTTVTGGIAGCYLTLTCVTSGVWAVAGQLFISGIAANPFATS
jgi:hypothetical protein